MNGAIIVDKPQGWTSHDVVNRIRRLAATRKVGHLGTLDPMATGVLPLLLNRATRLAQFFGMNEKEYIGTIRFGYATNTYDAEGEPVSEPTVVNLTPGEMEHALALFHGAFEQVPPAVSAKKIAGRPAYELARKNIPVELKPVQVAVHALEILSTTSSEAVIRVRCSAGTYIRSIAHDAGQRLGCGAHLASLRRIASGGFTLGRARTLDELGELASAGRLEEAMIPGAELLPELPSETVDSLTELHIRQGREFRVSPFRDRGTARLVKAVNHEGQLVAIGEAMLPTVYHPVLVL